MDTKDLKNLVKDIVAQATVLKDKYTEFKNAPVNYACIFSQSNKEYEELLKVAQKIGKVIKETSTGPLLHIKPLKTVSGFLQLLKIRMYDPNRPERGDADFTISNFAEFEAKYLSRPNFRRMEKPNFYMLELADSNFNVRVYFSNPPLTEQFGIQ